MKRNYEKEILKRKIKRQSTIDFNKLDLTEKLKQMKIGDNLAIPELDGFGFLGVFSNEGNGYSLYVTVKSIQRNAILVRDSWSKKDIPILKKDIVGVHRG